MKGEILVFDPIRKKFIVLTPEEWVRQNLIRFLLEKKKYPLSLFGVEKGMKLNSTSKRTDILVHGTDGNVLVLAECKAPTVKLTTETIEQALRYNLVHTSSFVILSNGLEHVFFEKSDGKLKQIAELPDYK